MVEPTELAAYIKDFRELKHNSYVSLEQRSLYLQTLALVEIASNLTIIRGILETKPEETLSS